LRHIVFSNCMKTLNKKEMKLKVIGRDSVWTGIVALMMVVSSQSFGNEPVKGPAFSLAPASTLSWEGSKPGGGHNGIVEVVNGNIFTDNGKITGGSFAIDMASIVCYDVKNKGMNQKLVGHLKSEDFFHVEKYPNASFQIFSVAEMSPREMDGINATHMVSGDLKIKDRVQRVSFPAEIKVSGDKVYAKTSEIVLDRTRWEITTMSKSFFAELRDNYVNDEFIVRLDLKFNIN